MIKDNLENQNKKIPVSQEMSVITVDNLSKTFIVPHEKVTTLHGTVLGIFKKKHQDILHALKDISFEIKKGEFFGVIGRNGSGKSTLLKIIAGVYTPSAGTVQVNGKISPFLELGVGFNMELSGRDNIYLNATVLGMARKKIDQVFHKIVAFAEIERFIDQTLRNYSSGMKARLAFSIATHVSSDIVLLDEVFAVGDKVFRQKCMKEFKKYREQGKTVIMVSHDTNNIKQFCDRAILLENGHQVICGAVEEVVKVYEEHSNRDSENTLTPTKKQIPEREKIISSVPAYSFSHDEMLLSIHIPKTAGTTFGRILAEQYKDKFLYVYSSGPHKFTMASTHEELTQKKQQGVVVSLDELLNYIQEHNITCIHGHLNKDSLVNLVDIFRKSFKKFSAVAFVREPLARAYSELCHHKIFYQEDNSSEVILGRTHNLISRLLELVPQDIVTICHSEDFDAEIKKLGFSWDGVRDNVNKEKSKIPYDESLIKKFNEKDIAFYKEILQRFPRNVEK